MFPSLAALNPIVLLLFLLLAWVFTWSYRPSLLQWLSSHLLGGHKPSVFYQEGSAFCDRIVNKCPILQEKYTPPFLWGRSGHVQSIMFGLIGRFNVRPIRGHQRYSVATSDGSTLYYDLHEPEGDKEDCPYTILVCPGIGNSSESKYMSTFTSHALACGFRVLLYNHLGALKGEKLTGPRIFTYGGTGDLSAIFDHASKLHPNTRWVGIGFSLGGCILTRFLGEDSERQRKFVCAASVCQGYDPMLCMSYLNDWTNLRCFYNYIITQKQLAFIRRHSDTLLTSSSKAITHDHNLSDVNCKQKLSQQSTDDPRIHPNPNLNTPSKTTQSHPLIYHCHGNYDHNGIALDISRVQPPDYQRLNRVTSMLDLDEFYTRRVCGFSSVVDLYRWTSCIKLLYEINDLPVLIVNTNDDPLVVLANTRILDIPKSYVEHNSNALLVIPKHGGHLGFFEGGAIVPNTTSWIDRLLVQYAQACSNELTD